MQLGKIYTVKKKIYTVRKKIYTVKIKYIHLENKGKPFKD